MTKLLCWLRLHDWKEAGTKLRTAPSGALLKKPVAITQQCSRCKRVKDLRLVTTRRHDTLKVRYQLRERSRVEKLGDAIVLAAILIVADMLIAIAREYWG